MSRALAELVARAVAPIKRRVMLMVRLGRVLLVDDGPTTQDIQAEAFEGEVHDAVKAILPYGFTHHPHAGAEAILLFPAGGTSHGLAVVVGDRRYRLRGLAEGEVALHDDQGQQVHLTRDGIIVQSPLNILLRTDGVLRLEGDGVEIHGRTYVQTDVRGKGSRETWTGGASWAVDSYQLGAETTSAEHGIAPPAIPSDHPEG